MIAWGFILLGCLAWLGAAQPIDTGVESQLLMRERRSERSEHPFNPQATMGGSFNGGPSKKLESGDCTKSAPHPEEERSAPETHEEEEGDISMSPAVPERQAKASKVPKRRQAVDEEEVDNDEEETPVARKGGKSGGGTAYRDFFAMSFGGAGRNNGRDAEGGDGAGAGGHKGSVMAIANSFSKGRGAIASSSAVAHGNPEASQGGQSESSRYSARP